jgi:hypothetical protein
MKYDVHFSDIVNDQWKFQIIEADTKEEAMKIVFENNKDKVNYILSCTPIN